MMEKTRRFEMRPRGPSLFLKRHVKDAVIAFGESGASAEDIFEHLCLQPEAGLNKLDSRTILNEIKEALCSLSTLKISTASPHKPLIRIKPETKSKVSNIKFVHSDFLPSSTPSCYLCNRSNHFWELIGGDYRADLVVVLLRRILPSCVCEECFREIFYKHRPAVCVGVAVLPSA